MREAQRVAVVMSRFEPVLAIGLSFVLRGDRRLDVLESGLDHTALLRALVRWAPQVAILDETAERALGRRLRSMRPATGRLVFAHQPEHKYGMMLLAAGATCVARSAPPDEILAAVHLVAEDGRVFVTADGERIERRYPENAPALTPREIDVLKRLSEDKPHQQIAHELEIGLRTVHTHASQIFGKLGVRRRRELIGMPIPDVGD
jgi:DNA-binding NarL/FixJ family response regulator